MGLNDKSTCWDDTCFAHIPGFCDNMYIEHCLQVAACDGYARCDDSSKCLCKCGNPFHKLLEKGMTKVCDECCKWPFCCPVYCICTSYIVPMFILIVSTFWLMVGFLILFSPPLFFVLMSTPMLRAKQLGVFDFIPGTGEKRADPSNDGHVGGWSSRIYARIGIGWFKCFLISILLCLLGWIPGVIFAFGFTIHYLGKLVEKGWPGE